MCMSGPKIPPPVPERQVQKLPDAGSTAALTDEDARRRRALATTAFTGSLGLGVGPSTTSVLGG
jgi:hypothetical protein